LTNRITELERYFGAKAANEWDLLLGHLEFSTGFSLVVILVPDNTAAEVCARALESEQHSRGSISRAPTSSPDELQDLPTWLFETTHNDDDLIWISAVKPEPLQADPEHSRWITAWTRAAARLNERRNTLRNTHHHPLILVGAPWLKVVLRENAPDLWSVRDLVVEMRPEARKSAYEQDFIEFDPRSYRLHTNAFEEVITTDPDYAHTRGLGLEDYPANTQERLELLRREFSGYSAQGRWTEALSAAQQALDLVSSDADRAKALKNLGEAFNHLSDLPLAVENTQKAVDIFRRLAQGDPQTFNPDLATGLIDLGYRLATLGENEKALQISQEAVSLSRSLTSEDPQMFTPFLGFSLSFLGIRLHELGLDERALEAKQEAANLLRLLTQDNPDLFKTALPSELSVLGIIFSDLKQYEQALQASQEATHLYRVLARDNPQEFNSDLAVSLYLLGGRLNNLGRFEEALQATQEATDLYRVLTRDNPQKFDSDLASSLNIIGIWLSNLGRFEEALQATQEATDLYRVLARDNPQKFNSDLASSLNHQGDHFKETGDVNQAHRCYEEATRVLALSFYAQPEALADQMAYTARDYLNSSQTLNLKPDTQLIDPILQKLRELGLNSKIFSSDVPSPP
jgi:tetratricopeptide (TPR) repeat protein